MHYSNLRNRSLETHTHTVAIATAIAIIVVVIDSTSLRPCSPHGIIPAVGASKHPKEYDGDDEIATGTGGLSWECWQHVSDISRQHVNVG